ncbi:ATP-binding SpoIIE family protein phosphatase [Simiduia agarivorans]|uniref:Response regulator n=1 Tax=Simiduia agarivorans (strain DSM 21679 / JCM 13881 / BCRC 17597 / SA1) TaxID=1117647 RepID=K4KFJ1_SIMAS|nr:fused response regulator/phosphatase [Simiduia agarivorans]AFU97691.1 response regulator [Simiduia agarivorans SA1 = DSM 21679]
MTSAHPLTILVADDTKTDRLILETIVKKDGHRVISAENGLQAVEKFTRDRPDLVLLDALMPEMDGFEAARQIKEIAGDELVPIIFLTSLNDTQSLVRCLEAGGDDFLSKPYNRVILQAKIGAFSRMRDMHSILRDQRNQIQLNNQHMLQEQAVAKQVFDNIAHSGCLHASNVRTFMSPLAVFNGDVLVAAMRPSGSMFILLGDFTGHGLPAAIGAMPLAATFYGMTPKGFSQGDILQEINQKLKSTLPVGLFCCAAMVEMNFERKYIRVWNGGLPDCYLYRNSEKRIERIASTNLPLGVVAGKSFREQSQFIELAEGDRFFMWSDGIHEARNATGEMFGEERLQAVFEQAKDGSEIFDSILKAVQAFVGEGEKDDDLSLVELCMTTPDNVELLQQLQSNSVRKGLSEWKLSFEIKAASFKFFDPLPMLLDILQSVPGLRKYGGNLYTILAELYSNALEHGVLELDSAMKDSPDGFVQYYQLRAERLETTQGSVTFGISHKLTSDGGALIIRVKDSGKGFDYRAVKPQKSGDGYCGRGIALLSELADRVEYIGCGNEVELEFQWHSDDPVQK